MTADGPPKSAASFFRATSLLLCAVPSSATKGSFGGTPSVFASPLSSNFLIWQMRISLEETSPPPVDGVLLDLGLKPARPPSAMLETEGSDA